MKKLKTLKAVEDKFVRKQNDGGILAEMVKGGWAIKAVEQRRNDNLVAIWSGMVNQTDRIIAPTVYEDAASPPKSSFIPKSLCKRPYKTSC